MADRRGHTFQRIKAEHGLQAPAILLSLLSTVLGLQAHVEAYLGFLCELWDFKLQSSCISCKRGAPAHLSCPSYCFKALLDVFRHESQGAFVHFHSPGSVKCCIL